MLVNDALILIQLRHAGWCSWCWWCTPDPFKPSLEQYSLFSWSRGRAHIWASVSLQMCFHNPVRILGTYHLARCCMLVLVFGKSKAVLPIQVTLLPSSFPKVKVRHRLRLSTFLPQSISLAASLLKHSSLRYPPVCSATPSVLCMGVTTSIRPPPLPVLNSTHLPQKFVFLLPALFFLLVFSIIWHSLYFTYWCAELHLSLMRRRASWR